MMPKKSTQCVHAGAQVSPQGGVNTPVFASTAYDYLDGNVVYPRYFNTPNQQVIEQKIAALEQAESALVFSSGMAALSSLFVQLLNAGDHLIVQAAIYGGTRALIEQELSSRGIACVFTEKTDLATLDALRQANTKMIFVESPSNPLLSIIDLEAVGAWSSDHQLLAVIDNTFASPINQNPLNWGFDLVMHSGTKYLGGHSDLCFGALAGSNTLIDRIRQTAILMGGNLNAQTCALIERSMKTLAIRVEAQNKNALQLAEFLEKHPSIERVLYPGLRSHRGHETATKQMNGYGGMLSFETKGGSAGNIAFQKRLGLITPAVSLGGVETTIASPMLTSHAGMVDSERRSLGISDWLLRLSVGIEAAEDLMADLDQALRSKA